MKINLSEDFSNNFIKLLQNDDYKINEKLYEKLHNTINSKNVNKEKMYEKMCENENNIIKLLKENKIEKITNKFDDVIFGKEDTIYNKFRKKYNEICDNYNDFFNNIIINNIFVYNNSYETTINKLYENIYEPKNNEPKNDNLASYYNEMYKNQLTKKNQLKNKNQLTNKNENKPDKSKYDYSLNKSKIYLVKFRKMYKGLLMGEKEKLEITKIYLNLKKVIQALYLLKPFLKYCHNNIVNEDLRLELLTLISTLQGIISRSNHSKLSNKNKKNQINIRKAFKNRILNNINNNNFIHNYETNNNKKIGIKFKNNTLKELELNLTT